MKHVFHLFLLPVCSWLVIFFFFSCSDLGITIQNQTDKENSCLKTWSKRKVLFCEPFITTQAEQLEEQALAEQEQWDTHHGSSDEQRVSETFLTPLTQKDMQVASDMVSQITR